ncbi:MULTISPECIES: DUF2868 domain-containing protein [unclassified Moraxella]|uniref:DUF2868 domain-containing protein n=1 Tax=unclassified Moraxella TaxID=2685852 RepID=UPI003AF62BC4
MYTPQDQLTELVRLLEEKNHIFTADPILITEKLQKEPSEPLTKLRHRTTRIDSDGKLAHLLATIDSRINGSIWGLTLLWFVLGFVGLFGVMQVEKVNFFYILASLLGFNTLMLLVWLGYLLFAPRNKPTLLGSFFSPSTLVRGKDTLTQTAVELYQQQLNHAGTKWFVSRISHQFWLASLLGMLLSLILLLLVKNYNFVWESTLLQNSTVVDLINIMGWLPNLVGFPTPSAQDIITAQMNPDITPQMVAFRWAMLLIGSLVMYGIAPRLIAWLFCLIMVRSSRMKLDIKQPYYQKIIDFWQRKITDPDDSPTELKPVAPTAQVSTHKKLVALLEYPVDDEFWYQFAVGHNVENFGIVDDRDDMARLTEQLASQNVQVCLGIPPQALPDRGTMRKLDSIAQHSKGGLIVQLLDFQKDFLPSPTELAQLKTRKEQWETALAERQIPLVRIH